MHGARRQGISLRVFNYTHSWLTEFKWTPRNKKWKTGKQKQKWLVVPLGFNVFIISSGDFSSEKSCSQMPWTVLSDGGSKPERGFGIFCFSLCPFFASTRSLVTLCYDCICCRFVNVTGHRVLVVRCLCSICDLTYSHLLKTYVRKRTMHFLQLQAHIFPIICG